MGTAKRQPFPVMSVVERGNHIVPSDGDNDEVLVYEVQPGLWIESFCTITMPVADQEG
jgi:hypothetical protein